MATNSSPHPVRAARVCALTLVAIAGSATSGASSPPVVYEFDGCLPQGATLTRATPRHDATGALIPADTPRFADDLIAPAARLITSLTPFEQVLDARVVNGVEYTFIVTNLRTPSLATTTPRCSEPRQDILPHPAVLARFGWYSAPYGAPRSAEIFPDGTVLVHCNYAGATGASVTLRTSVTTFDAADGWALVRTSDYVPPPEHEPAYVPVEFTRATYLHNLGTWVSTVAEYWPMGLVSSVDPDDGRALGYASTDLGLTWTRIIDTDDPALGRGLVQSAKHLHHLEPFEWYDESAHQWKIGAVGCLGDAEGQSGQIWVHSPTGRFPPEGQNELMTLSRTRKVGRRAATDMFPLDNAQSPGESLRFLVGNDGELAGFVECRVRNGFEENIPRMRPTVPHVPCPVDGYFELPQYPFLFQIDRITNGSLVTATTEALPCVNPNGMWISDPAATRWTMMRLADSWGYKFVIPAGSNAFWTQAVIGTGPFEYRCQLWKAGDVTRRRPVMLGAAAHDSEDFPLFDTIAPPGTLTDVTGTVAPPEELPATSTVQRLTCNDAAINTVLATRAHTIENASPGEIVQIVFWLKPAPIDAGCQSFQMETSYKNTLGTIVTRPTVVIDHETNMWARVGVAEIVPPEGMVSMTVKARVISGDATPQKPIDFYTTRPVLFVSRQPLRQHVPATGADEDRLAVRLPALGEAWTVAVLATEARTFAMTLADADERTLSVVPRTGLEHPEHLGADSMLVFSSNLTGSPAEHGATTAQDIFFPAQDLVFIRKTPGGTARLVCARGMGDLDTIIAQGIFFTPTTLSFRSPDGSIAFEGNVHRVRVWTDRALTDAEMRAERFTLPDGCAEAPTIDVSEPLYPCEPPEPAPCIGDVTGDGATDIADFHVLVSSFGEAVPDNTSGDLNGDGLVNASDFVILAGDFGCGS